MVLFTELTLPARIPESVEEFRRSAGVVSVLDIEASDGESLRVCDGVAELVVGVDGRSEKRAVASAPS